MSLTQSMFVVGVVFDNGFIIQNLYELLPIVPINNFNFIKGETIPFFGYNDAIVSVVPKIENNKGIIYKSRGVRNSKDTDKSSSSFGNSVTVDFQTHGKNLCIKISSSKKNRSKFHITGLKSYEMAKEGTINLLNQIKLTEKAWTPFFKLSFEERYNVMNWIINLVNDNGNMLNILNSNIIEKVKSIKDNLGDLYDCVNLILRYTLEDNSINDFMTRLYRIVNLSTGLYSIFHQQNDFKILLFDIYNGVYNGRICNNVIFLPFIANKLLEMGFQCGFFNVKKTEIRIMVPILNEMHYTEDNKNTNIKGHLFRIGPEGSVELYSRGNPQEAMTIGMCVINAVRSIISSDEYRKDVLCENVDISKCSVQLNFQNLSENTNNGGTINAGDTFTNYTPSDSILYTDDYL